jgi:protein SCO1/2
MIPRRTARFVLVFAAFLGALATVLAVVLVLAKPHGATLAASGAKIGGHFQLVDQNGRMVTEADFKGAPSLVFFGFTHCPDACPTTLMELSDVLKKLGGDAGKVHVVFITVDPERDNPGALKDYLSSFDPQVVGLTGDAAAIASVTKEYRVYYKKVPTEGGDYTMDHTALVYLMDRNGHFVSPFSLKRSPEDAAADLRRYL